VFLYKIDGTRLGRDMGSSQANMIYSKVQFGKLDFLGWVPFNL